jgi:hypothetical protein
MMLVFWGTANDDFRVVLSIFVSFHDATKNKTPKYARAGTTGYYIAKVMYKPRFSKFFK